MSRPASARALIVAAARSGAGKTSLTAGLMHALAARGLAVRGAKSGPDYIDPAFHAAATGAPGLNLDSFAMAPPLVAGLLGAQAAGADVLIIESAMGLFDGLGQGSGRDGSAADLARAHGLPVLMVLDVSGQSQTAAAVALGLARFDPGVRVAGLVLNQVASPRHEAQVRAALAPLGLPVVGAVPRNTAMSLPERHLGLVQAREHPALAAHIARLGAIMAAALDLDAILALAAPLAGTSSPPAALPPPGQRIAVADDAAFAFFYAHLAAGWRAAGAELVPFSPLADEAPPAGCDVCWLPGGYPELHAGRLAGNRRFMEGLRAFAGTRPVHGECGGYMVLGEGLVDAEGRRHAMAGLLGHATSFADRRLTLGYRRARLRADCPLGPAGGHVRGHAFHYSTVTAGGDDAALVDLADGQGAALGPAGGRRGLVSGTYFHAIAAESRP